MRYTLENDTIKITASTKGGELHSITGKKTSTEYLWNGNKNYWKYRAPILFPIVGKVIDDRYRTDGQSYELPPHGLARISTFALLEQTKSSLAFELKSSPESLKLYPYRFALRISYTLGDHAVTTTLQVINQDTKPILFSIGAHPAFLCPIDPADRLEDCYLEFSETETASILPLAATGFISRTPQPYLNHTKQLDLKKELFHNDALIFHKLSSKTVAIKSRNNTKALTVSIDEFPWLGLWAPKDGAPFLCIEPWQGHADFDGFTGEFRDKAGIVSLAEGQAFSRSYTIAITE